MTEEARAHTDVVPITNFAKYCAVKTALFSAGGLAIVIGTAGFLLALFCVLLTLRWWIPNALFACCLLVGIAALAISGGLFCSGTMALRKAQRIPRVVPLTRRTAADLPAPISLVRASSEPIGAELLVRAAGAERDSFL